MVNYPSRGALQMCSGCDDLCNAPAMRHTLARKRESRLFGRLSFDATSILVPPELSGDRYQSSSQSRKKAAVSPRHCLEFVDQIHSEKQLISRRPAVIRRQIPGVVKPELRANHDRG